MTKKVSKNVLSLDPSFSGTGYAILEKTCPRNSSQEHDCGYRLIDYGWIVTTKTKGVPVWSDDIDRSMLIVGALFNLVKTYNIKYLHSEVPLGSQSASAAKALGITKGIISSIASFCDFEECLWINPLQVKLKLCGNRHADKSLIAAEVEKSYPQLCKIDGRMTRTGRLTPFYEAVCDAIAVTLAISRSNS